MKKIAFVISSMSSGGAERVVSVLSNELCSRFKIFIITMTECDSFYHLNSNVTLLHCTERIEPSANAIQALKLNLVLYKAIVGYIKGYNLDLCVGFMTPNNILSTLAAKRCGIPVIISERNNPYIESQSLSTIWKYLRKFTYPKADKLVVQTEKIKSFYINFIENDRLEKIPNPINPDFSNTNDVKKYNTVLNVGRLTDQKNQKMLISAFAMTNNHGWNMKIVGEGKLRVKLELLIKKLNMEHKIHLVGRQGNVEEFYKEAKIFAFSSNYEGFPNALQEAMYFGLPSISTDCPTGPSELISDGDNGFLIPLGDINSLSEKLDILMHNDILRSAIGKKASDTMGDYKVEKIITQWMVLFDDLLK